MIGTPRERALIIAEMLNKTTNVKHKNFIEDHLLTDEELQLSREVQLEPVFVDKDRIYFTDDDLYFLKWAQGRVRIRNVLRIIWILSCVVTFTLVVTLIYLNV